MTSRPLGSEGLVCPHAGFIPAPSARRPWRIRTHLRPEGSGRRMKMATQDGDHGGTFVREMRRLPMQLQPLCDFVGDFAVSAKSDPNQCEIFRLDGPDGGAI